MTQPPNLESRVAALETRIEEVAADASAARHLAAARDRDLADLTVKVDANREVISALGEQTRARFDVVDRRFDAVDRRFDLVDRRFDAVDRRFDEVDGEFAEMRGRFDEMDRGFAEMRGRLDQLAGGVQVIPDLLTRLLPRGGTA